MCPDVWSDWVSGCRVAFVVSAGYGIRVAYRIAPSRVLVMHSGHTFWRRQRPLIGETRGVKFLGKKDKIFRSNMRSSIIHFPFAACNGIRQ